MECNGAGWYVLAVPYGHPDFGRLFPCSCTVASRAAAAETARARMLQQLHKEMGPKLSRCQLDTYDVDRPFTTPFGACSIAEQRRQVRQAWRVACDYAHAPAGWLAFFGTTGAGKSHLAAGVANALIQRRIAVAYASVQRHLRFVKIGFADHSDSDRLEALMESPVLLLDDLGTEQQTDWNKSTLVELFQYRYNHELPMIITSNVPRGALEARIDDRITELAHCITLTVQSYRDVIQQQRQEESA